MTTEWQVKKGAERLSRSQDSLYIWFSHGIYLSLKSNKHYSVNLQNKLTCNLGAFKLFSDLEITTL